MTGLWCDPNHDDFFRSPRFEPGKLPFSGRGESPADIVQSFAQLLRGVCPVHKGGKDSRLAKSKHSFGKIGKVRVNSCHTVPPSAPEVREKRLRTAGKLASVLCYDADEAFAVKIPGKYRR
jgi:hypothetical protein